MTDSPGGIDTLAQLRVIATQKPTPVTKESLAAFLSEQPELRGKSFEVVVPQELIAAGASGGLLMFEIAATGDAAAYDGRYVLRYELGEGGFFSQTSLPSQFQIMRAVHERGVPVAEAMWIDETGTIAGGATALIMRRIDARAPIIQYVQAGAFAEASDEVRETMIRSLMANLAKIHALPLAELKLDLLGNRDGRDPHFIANEIDWALRELYARFPEKEEGERAELHETIRRTLTDTAARLKAAIPDGVQPVLVHGDPTVANTMFGDDDKVAAMLDWELAHAGLAAEDPFYFTYAARSIACLGDVIVELPKIEDALRYYEEAGGKPEHVEFASALAAFKITVWGAIGLRRMPKAFWEAERQTWKTQSGFLADAMAKLA